jgi:hypothetical protein
MTPSKNPPVRSRLLNHLPLLSGSALLALLAAACSSPPTSKSEKDLALRGPTVVDARAEPDTFELNRELELRGAEVVANVQDFNSRIKSVKLTFARIPLEIPLKHVAGNTWRAELSDKQLQKLAVDGTTMKYDAYIVATDHEGMMSTSPKPITIAVKAPSLSQKG